jgi:hypothetical protein
VIRLEPSSKQHHRTCFNVGAWTAFRGESIESTIAAPTASENDRRRALIESTRHRAHAAL